MKTATKKPKQKKKKPKSKPALFLDGGWLAKMSAKLEAMRKMFPPSP